MKFKEKLLLSLLSIIILVLIWSGINPKSYGVWFLEVFPVLFGVPLLILTYRRFEFSVIVYVFVTLHAIILMVGGHYTYAENPLFNWLKITFDLSRNYYDRLGHIAQGFFPALIIREVLLWKTKLKRDGWLFFIIISIVLTFSATYEFLEWGAAISLDPESGNAFLATQGDIWDTQWDMFLATVGGIVSLLFFSKIQDGQLRKAPLSQK